MVIRLGSRRLPRSHRRPHQHRRSGVPLRSGGPLHRHEFVLSSASGPTSPTAVSGYWKDGNKRPVTYQYNFGIQRDIGFKTILDFAYVGSNTHHNYQNYNFNAIPAGARFLPQNRDVTVAADRRQSRRPAG